MRAIGEAKDALTKALCALVMKQWPDDDAIATSLFFASLAIIRLADADGDERARSLLLAELAADKERRAAEGLST